MNTGYTDELSLPGPERGKGYLGLTPFSYFLFHLSPRFFPPLTLL
jgi:hypothetical protein